MDSLPMKKVCDSTHCWFECEGAIADDRCHHAHDYFDFAEQSGELEALEKLVRPLTSDTVIRGHGEYPADQCNIQTKDTCRTEVPRLCLHTEDVCGKDKKWPRTDK